MVCDGEAVIVKPFRYNASYSVSHWLYIVSLFHFAPRCDQINDVVRSFDIVKIKRLTTQLGYNSSYNT